RGAGGAAGGRWGGGRARRSGGAGGASRGGRERHGRGAPVCAVASSLGGAERRSDGSGDRIPGDGGDASTMKLFEPLGLDHVVLRVRDQDASRRFYTEVLGCTLDHVNERISLVQLRFGEQLLDLLPGERGPDTAGVGPP